jgi:molybdopterin molybdotransferase
VILDQYGIEAEGHHFADDAKEIEKALIKILADHNAVILSGGVSAGKYDYVPSVLEKLGVEKLFHGVAQRPGKPFWFGISSSQKPEASPEGKRSASFTARSQKPVVFALPGNPVSSFMCTIRYIIPWLEKSLGIPHRQQYAELMEDVTFKPALTYFLQVKLEHHRDGRLRAHPVAGHGSGDLANLVEVDAFLELEDGEQIYHKGGSFRVWGFRE